MKFYRWFIVPIVLLLCLSAYTMLMEQPGFGQNTVSPIMSSTREVPTVTPATAAQIEATSLSALNSAAKSQLLSSPTFGQLARELESGPVSSVQTASIEKAVGSVLGKYSYIAAQVPTAVWANERAFLATGNLALLWPDGPVINTAIDVGGLAVVAAVCLVTGVESLGIGCVAAFVVFGLIIAADNFLCPLSNLFGSTWGCSSASQDLQQAAIGTEQLIVSKFGEAENIQAIADTNLINAFNLTYNALGYEAAAAALNQLPNGTFNQQLDLAQSGVAQQLSSEFWAAAEIQAGIFATAAGDSNYYDAAGNTIGYYCSTYFGTSSTITAPSGGSCTYSAAETNPSSFSLFGGSFFGSTDGGGFVPGKISALAAGNSGAYACPQYFIQTQSEVSFTESNGGPIAGFTLNLIPVYYNSTTLASAVGGLPGEVNVTITAAGNGGQPWGSFLGSSAHWLGNVTLTAPLGGQNGMAYYVCTTSASSDLIPNAGTALFDDAFPVSTGFTFGLTGYGSPGVTYTMGPSPASPFTSTSAGEGGPVMGPAASETPTGIGAGAEGCQGNSGTSAEGKPFSASAYGGNSNYTEAQGYCPLPNGAQWNFGQYLLLLSQNAASQGQTYWAFLHYSLGYTNVDQVPVRCLVLSPEALLTPNQWQYVMTLNVSSMLMWYQVTLEGLGQTFGANSTLTSQTICGVHPHWQLNNSTIGFGTFGVGYVYVPGAGVKNSNGTALESWNNPKTWNISGEFYLSPTVANLAAIQTNHTFILPSLNPSSFYVEPFLKSVNTTNTHTHVSTVQIQVNATGPSFCVTQLGGILSVGGGSGTLQLNTPYGCGVSALNNFVTGFVTGNSSTGAGLTGSNFPTGAIASHTGEAVYLAGCYQAQNGATQSNVSYHYTTSCNFGINKLNSTGYSCNATEYAAGTSFYNGVPVGSCEPKCVATGTCSCAVLCGGGTDCGVAGFFGTDVLGPIAAVFSIFGTGIACDIAWVIVIVVTVFIVALIVWALSKATAGRRGRAGGGWS
jgi:hypothetical protein